MRPSMVTPRWRFSDSGHMNTDNARSARCERISGFARDTRTEPVDLLAPCPVEAVRVAPTAAPVCARRSERAPLAPNPDLHLHQLALAGDATRLDPSAEADGLAVHGMSAAWPDRRLGPHVQRHQPCDSADLRRAGVPDPDGPARALAHQEREATGP